jgi:hypothetical protein
MELRESTGLGSTTVSTHVRQLEEADSIYIDRIDTPYRCHFRRLPQGMTMADVMGATPIYRKRAVPVAEPEPEPEEAPTAVPVAEPEPEPEEAPTAVPGDIGQVIESLQGIIDLAYRAIQNIQRTETETPLPEEARPIEEWVQ